MPPTQPLAVLTRPKGLNETLAHALVQSGWVVRLAPALQINHRVLGAGERAPNPADYDLVVFVSGNAVAGYASQLGDQYVWPESTLAACVGLTTAQGVRDTFGTAIQVLHPAAHDTQDSESLWRVITARGTMPGRVLILRGQDGRDWLADQFQARGISVHLHVAYCRELATWSPDIQTELSVWAQNDRRVVWLLTSPHGVDSVMGHIEWAGATDWASRCSYIVTHPRLVEMVRHHLGMEGTGACIETSRGDLASLVYCFDKIRQNLHQN
jgi:uroporphyrinogen-III synthase